MEQPNEQTTETTNTGTSLHEKISQATATKAPSATANDIWFEEVEEIKDEQAGTDKKEPAPEPAPEPATETKAGAVVIPDKLKRQSAETATIMWTQLVEAACAFRINAKFKRRFTEDEVNRLFDKNLEDQKLEDITDANDKILATKWKRLLKERDRKILAIEFGEKEIKRTEESFYHVFQSRNITMPPEWALIANLGFQIIDRAIETEID